MPTRKQFICDASKYSIDHISEPSILLCARTASDAIELKEYLLTVKELPEDACTCMNLVLLWEQERLFHSMAGRWPISSSGLRKTMHLTDLDEELPQVAQTFRCIFKPYDYDLGVMYRVGEFVVLQDSLSERRERIMEISSIIAFQTNIKHL